MIEGCVWVLGYGCGQISVVVVCSLWENGSRDGHGYLNVVVSAS